MSQNPCHGLILKLFQGTHRWRCQISLMWGLCSFPGWVNVYARAWVLQKSTLSCFFSLAVDSLYDFSAGLPPVCIGRPLAHVMQEGTSCLPHLWLHHCLNLGYPFILRSVFYPCDSMHMTKWTSPKRNSKFQPGYHELIESPLKIRYLFSPCFKSILSFDTCWPKIIIYSVQPVVKRTQREILAVLFLQSFNWAWF